MSDIDFVASVLRGMLVDASLSKFTNRYDLVDVRRLVGNIVALAVEEMQQAKPEQPVSYEVDWSTAPEWAKLHAYDFDGRGFWYGHEPRTGAGVWLGVSPWDRSNYAIPEGSNWRDSLTVRPEPKPEPESETIADLRRQIAELQQEVEVLKSGRNALSARLDECKNTFAKLFWGPLSEQGKL